MVLGLTWQPVSSIIEQEREADMANGFRDEYNGNYNNVPFIASDAVVVNFWSIHTEHRLGNERIVRKRFSHFNYVIGEFFDDTIYSKTSATIELLGADELDVRLLAEELKQANKQDSVTITVTPVNVAKV
jgi:hypothetical protein